MLPDKYRKRFRLPAASARLRQQIAREAARRVFKTLVPSGEEPRPDWLDAASSNDLYAAKRKAAAVLGHRLRPGDLPSDAEVREQLLAIARDPAGTSEAADSQPDPEPGEEIGTLAQALDRFAIYKMRLEPLETVKLNPKQHPEGDALFHSLQVFHLARDIRPYDEEFLLAALLHDVGKAIDPQDHVAAGIESLRGSVTERTLWLIEHQKDLAPRRDRSTPGKEGSSTNRDRPISARLKRQIDESEYAEDLVLLRELDQAGRVPGQPVDSLDEVLEYLKGLEHESYLED
jgi:predicted HD phosphohydrolase